ncbi:MAG: translation initiation factor IF-2 [Candidatus Buchananbacteria bacterium]|jgi:translation initiation factor IF-2
MNVSELSRRMKITTQDLLEKLPSMGFDIGKRAIKVDDRMAYKIMEAWRMQEKKEREQQRLAEIREGAAQAEIIRASGGEVRIPQIVTVREFAAAINQPITKILTTLMKNGVLASMNERIDFDTASIIGEEMGYNVVLAEGDDAANEQATGSEERLKGILAEESIQKATRPPVIVVMGHVDHGKTKILDAIRKTDVVATESGGITQHIGAYQIHKNGRAITFIDTPGHEAFTAMRSRGARVADIAILVVAADDGVQPQTKEAIKIIQDAKLPFVVAINKIDKPEADIEKAKKDLSTLGLLPEDWGGDVICVPVSAKDGTGIDDLLETVLLVADMNKDSIMADPDRPAIGTIIESHISKGEGRVATILIQAGTLRVGDNLCVGEYFCGKVRALKDYINTDIGVAGPGTPAKIIGLKVAPEVGSILESCKDISNMNRDVKSRRISQQQDLSVSSSTQSDADDKAKSINLIIKADVLGSLEAIIESLAKKETPLVKIKIVGKGLGIITEADVSKAEATGAEIIGFKVKPQITVQNLARDKKVNIKLYDVIYHLIEYVEERLKLVQTQEVKQKLLGKLEVIRIFRKETGNMIIGGKVIEGEIKITDTAIVVRGGEAIGVGKIPRMECFRKAVEHVAEGQECGLTFEGKPVIEEHDVIEFYD